MAVNYQVDFSILFPTRERPHLLNNLINSIHQTTCDLSRTEVLVAYDDEDAITAKEAPRLMRTFPWLTMYRIPRIPSISAYHNWLFRMSRGRYIIVVNDDCLFETVCWDRSALEKLKVAPKDDILYGWINDGRGLNASQYCELPLISRRAACVMGHVMNPNFRGWAADSYIYSVFRKINRIYDLSPITIRHIAQKGDETHNNMERISQTQVVVDTSKDVFSLQDFITNNVSRYFNDSIEATNEISRMLVYLTPEQLAEVKKKIYEFI